MMNSNLKETLFLTKLKKMLENIYSCMLSREPLMFTNIIVF